MFYNNRSTSSGRRLGCDAFFNIIHHKEGAFVVTSFKIEHNHGPLSVEPSCVEQGKLDYQLTDFHTLAPSSLNPQNQTEALCVLFKRTMNDGIFDNYSDLLAKVKEYEQVSNTKFKRRLSVKLPENHPRYDTLKYRYLYFACHHSGKFRTESSRGQARSLKVGCRARFTAMTLDGQLHVKALYTDHNHPCSRKFLSARTKFRRVDREQGNDITSLINQLKPSPRLLENHYGINYKVADPENMQRELSQSDSIVEGVKNTLFDVLEDYDSDIPSRQGGTTCRAHYNVNSDDDWRRPSEYVSRRYQPGEQAMLALKTPSKQCADVDNLSMDTAEEEPAVDIFLEEKKTQPAPPAVERTAVFDHHQFRKSADAEKNDTITDEALVDVLNKATVDQLTRFAASKLASRLSLWDLLILRCKVAATTDAVLALFLLEFLVFVRCVQDFLRHQLDRTEASFPLFSPVRDSQWSKAQTALTSADENSVDGSQSSRRTQNMHQPFPSPTFPARHQEDVAPSAQSQPFVKVYCGFVQIETTEQVVILGLARGTYKYRLPLNFEKPTAATHSTALPQMDTPTSTRPHPTVTDDRSTRRCVSKTSHTAGATTVSNRLFSSSQSPTVMKHPALSQPFTEKSVVPHTVDQSLPSTHPVSRIHTAGQTANREPTAPPKPWIFTPPNVALPAKSSRLTSLCVSTCPRQSTVLPHNTFISSSLASRRESLLKAVSRSSSSLPPPSHSPPGFDPASSSDLPDFVCPTTGLPTTTCQSLTLPHIASRSRILDRGLDGPIPEEWISSGRFQPLMMESGSPSQLVLESVGGGVFHRTTGRLVFRPPSGSSPLLLSPPPMSSPTTPYSAANSSSISTTVRSAISNSDAVCLVVDSPVVCSTNDSLSAPPKSALEHSQTQRHTGSPLSSDPGRIIPQPFGVSVSMSSTDWAHLNR